MTSAIPTRHVNNKWELPGYGHDAIQVARPEGSN